MPRRPAPARLDPGILETTVERIVPGGDGLAYAPNRTLFIPGSAPGDRLRVRITRNRGPVAWAEIVEMVEPGADRVDSPHPDLARTGAADFAHLRYPAQLEAKTGIIQDSLRRIGGIEAENIPITASPSEWNYRTRAEWRHDPVTGAVGYLRAGSKEVVDLEHDPLVVPPLQQALEQFRERAAAGRLPDESIELRAAAAGDAISLDPEPGGMEPREIVATVAGEALRHDARCFFQANAGLLDPLVAEALRYADPPETGESLALDLYSGVGLFTLPLARRFRRVIGVESDPVAALFAQRNAMEADLPGVRIAPQPVEEWLGQAYRSYGKPPLILVDPPRAGLGPGIIRGILRLRPARITYVSCDPATLARDLKALLAGDYRLNGLAAFDLFPQTHHVETVVHLERVEED
jgi:23S rRNA (uracil1939-C5)-methyltransferase